MSERVLREDLDGLCTLTLNRPEKLNALDTATFEDLDAHLRAVQADQKVGCIVLRGAGRAFCAGADLDALGKPTGKSAHFKPGVIDRLGSLPQPVFAAVQGVCFTGGLELALACDFIVADATARFADTHGKWGLVGGWGISQRLPRRIGTAAAKRMMMTARIVEAVEAYDLGLVELLVPPGELDRTVDALAREILANSWFTNFETKRRMRETEALPLHEALAHERDHDPGVSPDHQQRVAAFRRS